MKTRFWQNWRAERARLGVAFPQVFPGRNEDRPALCASIREELVASGLMTRRQAGSFLAVWTARPRYLLAVAQGGRRVHLDGRIAEVITQGEQRYALRLLEDRRAAHVQRQQQQHRRLAPAEVRA